MKALSLTQPMAWTVFNGKDVENQPWSTRFRGRVMIHASKGFNLEHWLWMSANENRLGIVLPDRWGFIHGAVIGEVDIVDCVTNHGSHWFMGKYGLVLENPVLYKEPIPCRGMLGFFEPTLPTKQRRY